MPLVFYPNRTVILLRFYNQYFTKGFRSGDFSRFLAERLKSLLHFRDLLIIGPQIRASSIFCGFGSILH